MTQAAEPPMMNAPASSSSPADWNIAAGRFFFRHRNALFPIVIAGIVLFCRPQILFGSPAIDHALIGLGAAMALLGEVIRLTTIGFRYIERGGRNRQVYASRLVRRGVYGLTRNPMYVGNILIASGLCLVAGSPAACLTIIPFFLFIYRAIVANEESYLHARFGRGYAQYCRSVPRFWPSLRGLKRAFIGMRFSWARALRQDLSTILGLAQGLVWFPLWRRLWLQGWSATLARLPVHIAWGGGVFVAYLMLHSMKRRGLLSNARRAGA